MVRQEIAIAIALAMFLAALFFIQFKPIEREVLTSAQAIVKISEQGFYPRDLTIARDTEVLFINEGVKPHWPASDPHPTHEYLAFFDPQRPIPPGSSWKITFRESGERTYHDHALPHLRGTITVREDERFIFRMPKVLENIVQNFSPNWNYDKNKKPPEIELLLKEKNTKIQARIVREMAEKYGPKETLVLMRESGLPFTGETHLLVHEIGNVAYEKFGLDALKYCDESFLSACFHGVILNVIGDKGIGGLAEMVGKCREAGIHVFTQCSHASGHGFLAWEKYKVPEALPLCDELGKIDKTIPLFNCYDGVFMENIFGVHEGKPSPNRMVKPSDPYYPCNAVPEKYQGGCWANQATLAYQLFGGDLKKVASFCDTVERAEYQKICYHNFARQIHPLTEGKTERAVELCQNATGKWQDQCLITLVDAAFSVGDRERMPYEICAAIKNPGNKDLCYERLFGNIASYGETKDARADFCSKVKDDERRRDCREKFGIAAVNFEIDELKQTVKRKGSRYAYEMLKKTSTNPAYVHDKAHLIGKLAYRELGLKGFSVCDSAFAFGCYHGLFEDLIHKEGIEAISKARNGCLSLTPQGRVISCLHGIGHGLQAYKGKLKEALKLCDEFPEKEKIYCFDGVFMEYYAGIMQGPPQISFGDPWSFCLGLSSQYQNQCVRNHVFYLLYNKVGSKFFDSSCGRLSPDLEPFCTESVGLFAGQNGGPKEAEELCASFSQEKNRFSCVVAAARELIFQDHPLEHAEALCRTLIKIGESTCFQKIQETKIIYGK